VQVTDNEQFILQQGTENFQEKYLSPIQCAGS